MHKSTWIGYAPLATLLLNVSVLVAQTPEAFTPSHDEIVARYKHAARMDSLTKNAVFNDRVEAHWRQDEQSFWYENILPDGSSAYVLVDAKSGKKQLFTNKAQVVAEAPGEQVQQPNRQRRWGMADFRGERVSPDQQWEAYIEEGNLFAKRLSDGEIIQFTSDGTKENPYGAVAWSPDSKYLAGYLIHPVQDSLVHFVLSAVPETTRGQLVSRPYKQPGDPFTTYDLFVFPLDKRTAVKVAAEPIDFPNAAPLLRWRYGDARYFTYEKFDRGHQRFRVIEVDSHTGTTRNVVDERTGTFIYHDRQYTHYPEERNILIRSSEKDGWRHLYLVDLISGIEKPITAGEWVVRDVVDVDARNRQIWFTAGGMNAGEDPYHIHYYRIGFDGKGLVDLTPEPGNHSVVFSPSKSYYIDTYSTVNQLPVTKLRNGKDGKEIAVLEEAVLSEAYQQSGITPPEVFVAKGRDGVTDIWGIVSKPSDYDPAKKYPVLENIYAGPHDSFVPKSFVPYSEMQSLAELGFIVVMIDGMGTANRSKAFHDICWQNIADAGLPDRILWIKALAEKYPSVDTTRVGLYGTSAGGQNTVSALLFQSHFYKAGVAACGCYDNRVDKQWWNEQWMGYPVGPHYEAQSCATVANARKLNGKLLLIVGEADSNVPPESSYRVADALIRAGKTFDFLSIPGMGHSDGGPFGRMKKRDFFVKHLLQVEPPDWNAGELPYNPDTGRERWSFQ
ncbi:Dipeptidyl aminopeptidase/acylaminoacyl peptidase [Parapedobacter luteus]|uniref:Dipeptidyl aminopeptidase/acylaminoacyl peptidase n=1 Tax=Parapedobacter luteus TaxID=623280 RepID=A0A1T5F9P7_9SPHI|nr:S9 family peptidase [Parapedobacter luteus]SKB92854.1 Dipeptidyl aminopeptidase/acylaminoacyl peptidase [Parapedobacter luteus]